MILKRPVHVARGGRIIGEFSSSDLPILLERGEILVDDTCYIEESNEWQTVQDHIRATATPKAQLASESDEEPLETPRAPSVLLGSLGLVVLAVMLLFFLALIAAAGAWIYSLKSQLNSAKAQVSMLEKELLDRPRPQESEESEPAIPGERSNILGRVTLRDESGNSQPMPGFFVDLFEEKKLRDYLLSRSLELAAFKQSGDLHILGRVLKEMPQALLKTTTDADGRFEFKVPQEGRYILYTSTTLKGVAGPEIRMWFLSFATDDPLNLPVNINDENHTSRYAPEFMVREGRPKTASGGDKLLPSP